MSSNQIQQVLKTDLPLEAEFLGKLRRFNLSDNDIHYIEAGVFAQMSNLKDLDLSSNQLNDNMDPNVLKTIHQSAIETIDISGT